MTTKLTAAMTPEMIASDVLRFQRLGWATTCPPSLGHALRSPRTQAPGSRSPGPSDVRPRHRPRTSDRPSARRCLPACRPRTSLARRGQASGPPGTCGEKSDGAECSRSATCEHWDTSLADDWSIARTRNGFSPALVPPYLVCRPLSSMMRVGSPAVLVWLNTPLQLLMAWGVLPPAQSVRRPLMGTCDLIADS
jgi:hypothetical protein